MRGVVDEMADDVPVTGDAQVDAALALVGDLSAAPLERQVELLGQANDALAAVLSSRPGAGTP